MFYAAREGHVEAIQRLLQYGGDCDFVDSNGQTPLYYSARYGKYDASELLI